MHDEKYLVFAPFTAGFCNVLMSYEIGLALSYITRRKIIIPPTNWCVLIDEFKTPKEQWQDIWTVLDKSKIHEHFEAVDLVDFEPLQPYIDRLHSDNSPLIWTGNLRNVVDNVCNAEDLDTLVRTDDPAVCYYNDSIVEDYDDFEKFSYGRAKVNLNFDHKYLHTPGFIFGHYWYLAYPGTAIHRNALKKKINASLDYKQEYYDLADELMKTYGSYNAVHIRNPLQFNPEKYSGALNYRHNPVLLNQAITKVFDNDKPLYVLTDVTNKKKDYIFSELAKNYNLIFQEDLKFKPRSSLEEIAVDQTIAVNADLFYGSYYSTFSKRINVLRGIRNRQANDSFGFNADLYKDVEAQDPFPWVKQKNHHWPWHFSSYKQWTLE